MKKMIMLWCFVGAIMLSGCGAPLQKPDDIKNHGVHYHQHQTATRVHRGEYLPPIHKCNP